MRQLLVLRAINFRDFFTRKKDLQKMNCFENIQVDIQTVCLLGYFRSNLFFGRTVLSKNKGLYYSPLFLVQFCSPENAHEIEDKKVKINSCENKLIYSIW